MDGHPGRHKAKLRAARRGNTNSAEYEELEEELEEDMAPSDRGVHRMWRNFAGGNVSELYRSSFIDRSASWAVGNTLTMTVAFSMLFLGPIHSEAVPFSYWTMHLFQCFALLATIISVRGIAEIACVQEDLAMLPPALMSEWHAALNALKQKVNGVCPLNSLGGGRTGGACYEWTYTSLKILTSAAVFLIYTLSGPPCLVWLLPLYMLHTTLNGWGANHRCRGLAWRTLEAKIWSRDENRYRHPDEFKAWARGEGYSFLSFIGFPQADAWPWKSTEWEYGVVVARFASTMGKKLFCVDEITLVYDYVVKSRLLIHSPAVAEIERVRQLSIPSMEDVESAAKVGTPFADGQPSGAVKYTVEKVGLACTHLGA